MKVRINVPRSEVIRYLGYPEGREPRAPVMRRLDESWRWATELLQAQGCFKVVSQSEAAGAGMPEPSELVGVAACTIGESLTEKIQQLNADGDALSAFLLDAFGSAAAEATADIFSKILCNEATRRGLFAQQRISPGYGLWPTSRQKELFALLPTESVGIRLTDGQMMKPRKSVSFAMRFQDKPGETGGKGCRTCTMKNCEYRLEEAI